MQPSIKQLKYLVAVAEHRHFGRAAAACFVTQSTLSAGVHDLEEALGVSVFERLHKNVLITDVGKEVLNRAQRILQEVDSLVEFTAQRDKPLAGKITLGVIPTIAPFLLPKVLAALRENYPQAQIFLRESQTATLLEDLSAGRIDAALMAFPYPTTDMTVVHLFDDPFLLAYPPNSVFSKRKRLSIKHLEGCDLLLLEEGHCLRQHALEACKLGSAKYGVPYQGTSLPTLVQMVANGLGVTLLPKMAIDTGVLSNTDIEVKTFAEKTIKRSIGLVWRSTSAKATDLNLLADFIKAFHQS